jgi:anti-sigma regulatory factor (Ser/Thr protein kinase)
MEASIRLSPHPTSARAAREFVAETLLRWDRPDQSEAAVLLTSELVTNAIVHARTQLAVTVQLVHESLRVVVVDESADQPNRRTGTDQLAGGRGLKLVESLAASWGVSPEGRGKAVWFELA